MTAVLAFIFWLSMMEKPGVEGTDRLVMLDGNQGGHEQRSADVDIACLADSHRLVH